jgi:hypothetical protein
LDTDDDDDVDVVVCLICCKFIATLLKLSSRQGGRRSFTLSSDLASSNDILGRSGDRLSPITRFALKK